MHRTLCRGPTLQLEAGSHAASRAAGANRTGLPERLKRGVEALSGLSLDSVRVHLNSAKPAALQAHAYTQGTDIHVASGQERHLPHEAWHVVQQMQGRVKPTMQMKDGIPVNHDAALEHEADAMGARATRIKGAGDSDGRALSGSGPAPASRSRAQPVQRKITMKDGTVYEGAQHARTVIDKIKEAAPEAWNDSLGRTLTTMLNRGDNGPYASYNELLEDLAGRRQHGVEAAQKGKEREVRVAHSSKGSVADTGKYGDKVVHLKNSNRHVKLDNEGPSFYAITGGPAKEGNLVKFEQICNDLKVISAQDGKQPRVYCTADTPDSVIEVATRVVGAENVYEVESGQVWRKINPYAMDMPDYGKATVKDPSTGLPQGSMPYIN